MFFTSDDPRNPKAPERVLRLGRVLAVTVAPADGGQAAPA